MEMPKEAPFLATDPRAKCPVLLPLLPVLDLDHFADISEMVFDTLSAAEKGQFYLTKKIQY